MILRMISWCCALLFLSEAAVADPKQEIPSGIRTADDSEVYQGTKPAMFLQGRVSLGTILRVYPEITNLNLVVIDEIDESRYVDLPSPRTDDLLEHSNKVLDFACSEFGLTRNTVGNVVKVYKKGNPLAQRIKSMKGYEERLISLDLKDTSLSNVLKIIEEVSGRTFIGQEALPSQNKVTIRLIDVPWDQCLSIILETVAAEGIKEGKAIRIEKLSFH